MTTLKQLKQEFENLQKNIERELADFYLSDYLTYSDDIEYIANDYANSMCSIYTYDLIEFLKDNYGEVEEYINETGWTGSLDEAIRGVQYEQAYNNIYNYENEIEVIIKLYYCINYIEEISNDYREEYREEYNIILDEDFEFDWEYDENEIEWLHNNIEDVLYDTVQRLTEEA